MNAVLRAIILVVAAIAGWIVGTLVGFAITLFASVLGFAGTPDLTITLMAAILGTAAGLMLAGSRFGAGE